MSKYFELRKTGSGDPTNPDFVNLYPEITKHGSLGKALEAEALARGMTLPIEGFEKIGFPLHGATVRVSNRACQIMIAANERCFFADFRERGITLFKVQTQSLAVLIDAVSMWCEKKGTIREMQSVSSEVVVQAIAAEYVAGPEVMVERQWNEILRRAKESHPELLPVIAEAMKTVELRRLFPFTSLINLCFSGCTGYPFTGDCPHIMPLRSGRFCVRDINEKSFGEGDAREAIEMVVRNLPEGCSAAVHGTADDLD